MTDDKMTRPNIRRRLVLAGGAGLLAAGGLAGYLAMGGPSGSVHLTAATTHATHLTAAQAPAAQAPAAEAPSTAADTDNVQQGDQSGAQDATGVDTTTKAGAAGAAEAPSTEADGPGGHADPAGAAGQTGDNNN
ncbi:MAG TPA: hypothetical protein VIG86_09325 [Candidatus Dormibacteraeota bacterium]|jgi:hypothetical protein